MTTAVIQPQGLRLAAGTTPVPACPAAARPEDRAESKVRDAASARLAALAVAAHRGDADAFEGLVRESAARLFSFIRRLTDGTHEAEDVFQETWVKAHRALGRYDPSRPWMSWLFTIARRTALNHLRGRRPLDPLDDALDVPAPGDGPDADLRQRERRDAVWTLARRLKPRYHEVLWLHYGEGFPLPEVAAVMGVSRLGVKVLLHRARRAMLRAWRRSPDAPPRMPAPMDCAPLHPGNLSRQP